MVRDALGTEETAAVAGDEDIVLDAHTSEVLIGLQQVEVDELLAVSALFPVIDEGRDEVDARLIGNDETS